LRDDGRGCHGQVGVDHEGDLSLSVVDGGDLQLNDASYLVELVDEVYRFWVCHDPGVAKVERNEYSHWLEVPKLRRAYLTLYKR
jgi:hypothetical protein